jgi:hypothetical protein
MLRAPFVTTAFMLLLVSGSAEAQGNRGKALPRTRPVAPAVQHQRIQQQQQRATQYQQQLGKQLPRVQQQTSQLLQQQRAAQYRVQQQYAAQLRQQQQRMRVPRNYAHDPYITAPPTYRYNVSGMARETNQYGADVLRRAVSYGYQEGLSAGRADKQDRWSSDYQNSPAYQDATYGYDGNYVDQADYSYYFRQGFQRGYQDGYGNRLQYGSASNGTYSILGSVLSSILGLQSIQ